MSRLRAKLFRNRTCSEVHHCGHHKKKRANQIRDRRVKQHQQRIFLGRPLNTMYTWENINQQVILTFAGQCDYLRSPELQLVPSLSV